MPVEVVKGADAEEDGFGMVGVSVVDVEEDNEDDDRDDDDNGELEFESIILAPTPYETCASSVSNDPSALRKFNDAFYG